MGCFFFFRLGSNKKLFCCSIIKISETTISSTSKNYVVVRNKNTQNVIQDQTSSESQYKQRSQGQQDAPEKVNRLIYKKRVTFLCPIF